MKSVLRVLVVACFVLGLLIALSFNSGQVQAAQYPDVSTLKPFAPEANFMSLPGYLRFLVYDRDGVWLSRGECATIVKKQLAERGEAR